MSLKLQVGISQKIGQPNYGSLGASCNVEIELAPSLLFDEVASFHSHVTQAYAACRQAVNEELARAQSTSSTPCTNGKDALRANPCHLTNGSHGSRASQRQLDYAKQLASQIHGVRRLEALTGKLFGKPMVDLSSVEASGLIDVLNAIKAGKIELAARRNGVEP